MRTIQTNLYQYSELSDKAKEKARDWYRTMSQGDNYFSECVLEHAAQWLAHLGFELDTNAIKLKHGKARYELCIYWSGFWSRGDGACFTGRWRASSLDLRALADFNTPEIQRIGAELAKLAAKYPQASARIAHDDRYSHSRSVGYEFEFDPEEPYSTFEDAEKDFKEAARDAMDHIYESLEKEYEYQNSDEVIAENMEANEYEFTIDGESA